MREALASEAGPLLIEDTGMNWPRRVWKPGLNTSLQTVSAPATAG
ncbi:MAG: hypothetical protein R3D29_09795 [Nitratireductor sp.]